MLYLKQVLNYLIIKKVFNPKDASDIIDKELWIQELGKDPIGANVLHYLQNDELIDKNIPRHVIKKMEVGELKLDHDYIVYKSKHENCRNPIWRIYVPNKLRLLLFKKYHNACIHEGSNRIINIIRLRWYWPGMWADIEEFCKHCETCRFMKHDTHKHKYHFTYRNPVEPNHTVATDVIGPLCLTDNGNRYIFTFTDIYDGWTVLVPAPHQSDLELEQPHKHFNWDNWLDDVAFMINCTVTLLVQLLVLHHGKLEK